MATSVASGSRSSNDLEHDLQALLESAGEAARSAGTALILFIDELQHVEEDQMAALITPAEKRYLRAMAELGPGPHRSGDISNVLHRKVTALGPTRNQLISKGMIWSPNHGDTAFTVPMFDQFMNRIMPGDDWRMG